MMRILNRVILFIVLFLLQVLICNQILLFNVAVPIIYIYCIIRLPLGVGQSLLYTLAFFMGLCVDIFSDTPGMNSTAVLVLAALKKPILLSFVQRDDEINNLIPGISDMGIRIYAKYLFTMVMLYCIVYFSIEFFSFSNIPDILLMGAGSAVLSFLVLLGIDSLLTPSRERL